MHTNLTTNIVICIINQLLYLLTVGGCSERGKGSAKGNLHPRDDKQHTATVPQDGVGKSKFGHNFI